MSKLRAPAAAPAILCVLMAVPGTAGTITYEAFAGSIAGNGGAGSGNLIGNGSSGNGQSCTTAGPASLQIGSAFSTGLPTPAGGVGPCGYYGGSIDHAGSTSQTASTGTVAATFSNGSGVFSGNATALSASALNGEFALSADASSNYLGGTGSTTITQSAAGAAIDDPNWVISCSTCSPGSTYHPVFTLTLTANITANQAYIYQQDLYGGFNLNVDFQMTPDNQGELSAFQVYNYQNQTPSWLCYYNPVCPTTFTVGPGLLSGTSTFSFSPYDQGVTLGAGRSATVDEKIAFIVGTENTATADPNITLTAVNWVDGSNNPVSGITLTTSEGVYSNGGYAPFTSQSVTPEPSSVILCGLGLGLCAVGWLRRVRG